MNQLQVRNFVERYLSSFSAHVMESHPSYLTVKLPEEVDKDIGNRPFYWSWVEKMNIPPQPMVLTFFFDPENKPEGMRGEPIHFGSGRLQQIFQSTKKHGRFVCMFEHNPVLLQRGAPPGRRSSPLMPWLGVNLKLSFICDKKRDMLLYLGINLHQPRIVHDFYPFLQRLSLSPSIPDYFYTLDRRISLVQAMEAVQSEVQGIIAKQDQRWAEEARQRLSDELQILEAYYAELALREKQAENDQSDSAENAEDLPVADTNVDNPAEQPIASSAPAEEAVPLSQEHVEPPQSLDEYRSSGGRILDFLRMNGIHETPKEKINQEEWRKSTPEEEKSRRMSELQWQYEPRIEVSLINAGLFYLHNMPPFPYDPLAN